MNSRTAVLLLTTMAFAATVAQADDAPADQPIKTHKQLMNKCMAEQKAKASGASEDEMKKTCEERIKSYRNHPSAPTPESAPQP